MADSLSPHIAAVIAEQIAATCDDVIVAPGSRNSPLTLALLARRDLRVHVRIDERSAAFMALGMARLSHQPVAVLTTSGTAVANCLPAVIEAAYAHIPLVILSADRPRRLVGTGASQTIDQVGIFGSAAPCLAVENVTQAAEVAEAIRSHPQLQINIALDEPLLPTRLPEPVGRPLIGSSSGRPYWYGTGVDHGEVHIDVRRPTLVIAGDEAWEVPELAEVPTLAEPTAPAPFHPVHPLALGRLTIRPEQIVVVGHPTLHRDVAKLLADPTIELTVLSRTATLTDPAAHATQVGTRVRTTGSPSAPWLQVCAEANDQAVARVRAVLADPGFGLSGLHVAAAVGDTLRVGDAFFIAASNPVRDASLIGLPFDGVETFSPRGAAGIDGSVSQAMGIALATQLRVPTEPRAPRTVALLGDLAFLHDVGGLLTGPAERQPENLTIVVANDRGGGIFETLEIGRPELRPRFERGFGTPHEVDIAAICAGYGVPQVSVNTLAELTEELLAETTGLRVIEACTTREQRRALAEALAK